LRSRYPYEVCTGSGMARLAGKAMAGIDCETPDRAAESKWNVTRNQAGIVGTLHTVN